VSGKVSVRMARGGVLALCGWLLSSSAWSAEAQLVSKVDPEFPKEAVQAGESKGHVKARMTLSGTGEVVRVEILEAQPRRVFDRAVVKTLALWKYNQGADNRQIEIEVDFHR
jgi:periplasmic protein TonB